MQSNNLFSKYDVHMEAATYLLKDAQDVTIIKDKVNNCINVVSESEGINILIQTTSTSFYIEDVLEDISYKHIIEPSGEICITEKIGGDIFETTYIKGETGAIEFIESVNVIVYSDGNTKIIICEEKDIEYDELEDEEEYEEYDELDDEEYEEETDEEYTKEDLYSEYQVRINGEIIPDEQALQYIDKAYEKTIYLENDSENRAIQYLDLMEAIKFKINQIKDDIKTKNLEER